MTKHEDRLTKQGLIVIGFISSAILIIGITLLVLGFNEAFYIENELIQLIFEIITFTGEAIFFILVIAIFYFIYDKRFAKNLTISLLLSVYINNFLKDIFRDPRPTTNIEESQESGYVEEGFGFPSGHSQNAVAVWGYMGFKFNKKTKNAYFIPFLFSVLIFLIAVSRVIIGVHDLQDIVGGLLIGIGILLLFIYSEPIITPRFNKLAFFSKILITIALSVLCFLIGTLLFPKTGLGSIPNAQPYTDAGGYAQVGGVILGFGIGFLLESEKLGYDPSELVTKNKLINLIIGLTLTLAVYFALELFVDLFNSVFYRYIRYALVSFIVAYVLPFIFIKLNKE
jgi:membrane-associated phospholipid phosphatase